MCKGGTSLGRRLQSVALRYQTPVRDWPPAFCQRSPKWFLHTTISTEPLASAAGLYSRSKRLANLEAAFFLAREPQGTRRLAQLAGLADGTEARTLVRTLNRLYDAEGCAFRIEELAGGLQLMSRPKFAPWLRRLHAVPVEVRLSGPAMETLAVVAYRQPVLRAEIEAIRGVQCGELLRQLMDRDLVRIVGHSEELGRPFLYGTTRCFLQIFGLRHLDELPCPDLFCRKKNAAGNPADLNRDASGSDKGMFTHP
jgi:segregation and condensation protein B